VRFEGVDRASPWPRLLADAWPARLRPWTDFDVHRPTPYVTLTGGDFDAWLAGRSRNFRQQARRTQRKVAQAGGTMRLTSPADDVERDVANFVALHLARWSWRGGSGAITGGVEHMLREAARELVADGRLRLWTLEIDGAAISSHLFVAAGGEVAYFNGGFDERWADLKPSMHTILVALEDCFARGDRRMDLGLGVQPYKQRLADGDDPTAWIAIFPRDLRYPYTRAQALPAHLGSRVRAAGRRLPPDARERVRRLLGHAGGRR
jgi:CelD/BcsL family acetyltransferase involved in cellulose biosynthesis